MKCFALHRLTTCALIAATYENPAGAIQFALVGRFGCFFPAARKSHSKCRSRSRDHAKQRRVGVDRTKALRSPRIVVNGRAKGLLFIRGKHLVGDRLFPLKESFSTPPGILHFSTTDHLEEFAITATAKQRREETSTLNTADRAERISIRGGRRFLCLQLHVVMRCTRLCRICGRTLLPSLPDGWRAASITTRR